MGKGSTPRPHSIPRAEYERNYEAVFGHHKLKLWDPEADEKPHPQEEVIIEPEDIGTEDTGVEEPTEERDTGSQAGPPVQYLPQYQQGVGSHQLYREGRNY